MEKRIVFPNFHLFDGEAGAGAGEAASQSASEQDVKQVQYGRSTGEGQANSQVGSDNGGGVEDINAEWEALTGKGGKFHDLLGQRVSSAVQERFKNQADLQGQVDKIADDFSPLFRNYGLQSGDFEGLKNALDNDDALYKAGAERLGIDVEQYKRNLQLEAEVERARQITASYEEQQRQNELFEQWESDASELQKLYPGFDLGLEIENNERFAALLNNGVDVQSAFVTTHLPEILSGANAYHQRTATQQVANQMAARASRPMEGALNHAPAIQRKSDPSSLSNEDLDEINRRVAMGESISF